MNINVVGQYASTVALALAVAGCGFLTYEVWSGRAFAKSHICIPVKEKPRFFMRGQEV